MLKNNNIIKNVAPITKDIVSPNNKKNNPGNKK